ncbi:MAG: SDR family NAD(P)-dependent oxidoreductase [Aureliella sp.]
MAGLGQPNFAELAWTQASKLGEDVWHTQASMLIADAVLAESLRAVGCMPDIVAGHSFGEFAAMLAAGCWDLPTALRATWHRCQSIVDNAPAVCGMLSIQAAAEKVEAWIAASGAAVSLSHRNAPEQTVVGGKQSAVAQFAQFLENEAVASRLLAVPTAFHTPVLCGAQAPFARALDSIPLVPPRVGLLSSVSNRYVADPVEMRQGLVAQLVTPLDFVQLVERLLSDGVGLMLEVGPQQVLTRLVRQIAGSRAMIVSTDHPKRDGLTQLACARACLEVMRRQPHASAPLDATLPIAARSQSSAPLAQPSSPQPAPLHFDATERRRERMRSAADAAPRATVPTSATAKPSPAALHYDASQNRRQRNRHPAFAGAEKLPEDRGVVQAVQPTDAGALASPPPDASAPPAAPTDPSVASASADSGRIIESFLIDFVVEQTGYPAEIIELDWDIEADLGIDSIKKAQLFGELREFFDLESLTNFSLDRFRSLRDIVELLKTTPGKGDWLERRLPAAGPSASAPAPTQAASNEAASNEAVQNQAEPNQAEPNQAAASHSPASEAAATADVGVPLNRPVAASQAVQNDAQQLQRFLIDFVVEQTGYPEEIVELDADLEADLGIDSIKKAQLFGELREMFDFQTSGAADKRMSLSEYRTLRSVLELLLSSVATSARLPDPPSPTPAASNGVAAAAASRMATRLASPPHADLQPKPNGQAYLEPQSFSQAQANAQASSHPLVQPRSQSQSRLPSERGIAPSSEPTSGQLPMAWLTRAGVAVDDYYAAATLANLNAMVGRPHRATDNVRLHYNGAQRRVEQDVARLAVATQTAELSLLALDACLAAQMQWRPLQPAASSPNDSTASTSMMPILEAIAPSWLSSGGGVPLAIHLRQSPDASATIELLAPGCNISSTLVTHNGFLLAGGQLEPNRDEHAQLQLVDWLHQQTNQLTSLPQFDAAARKLKLAGDWWLMAVDLHSAQRVLIESRDGLIVIEKGALTSAPKADACLIDCAARIWLDPAGRALVIEAQQTAVPRLPHRLAIPLDNLQPWLAQPGPAGQSTSDDSQSSQAPDAIKNVDIDFDSDTDAHANVNANADGAAEALTRRFVLRMVPAPQRPTSGRRPAWSGTALVIGDNPVATQLEARLRGANVPVVRWSGATDPEALAKRFDELASEQAIRHLFLTTPCDAAAHSTLDRSAWQRRRNEGVMSLFWLCQRWHEHVTSSGWVDDASLVAVTSMGGDFGVGGNLHSIEGGGLTGLLKSILIESWVRGFRTFPIKILDTSREDSPAQIVDHIWDELAVPSFDIEVAYPQGERHVVRAIPQPLSSANATATGLSSGSLTGRGGRIGEARSIAPAGPHRRQLSRGAAWVCTGGARGITAYVVEQLAARYQLKVHLLGTAPLPVAQASARELDEQALRSLKADVMTSARTAGKNPITTWQDTEKALEIARNLQRFEQLGIEAHYHQCDVSDREQVREVLERVRAISGPIRGVLHGAGVGKDARFDRKQPDKVNQCIGAKVDGAWSLIEATWNDPLETFVGFGSISGRFGANGHTDYSLANDMLCKQMDWLRSARPEVHAVGFHWHAWGDVGMATKPETRLALEMIQMQFMPAAEGVRHLIRELESDRCESEVLITDDRYYRLFTSPDPSRDSAGRSLEHRPPATPLLCPADQQTRTTDADRLHTATLDPVKDPFLAEHRLDDAPLLPIVVGAELLLEGARAHLGHVARLKLCQLEAVQGLRFFSDQPQTVKVATSLDEHGHIDSRLLSDFRARDGRLVQSDRLHIAGRVEVASGVIDRVTRIALPLQAVWNRPLYPAPGSKFFVGPSLQRLRGFAIVGESLVGRIIAPALIELAGGGRDVRGWQLPSAAVDACLFATGILAWQVVAPGSALPAGFGEIEIGRLPLPGEACEVHVRLRSHNVGAPPSEATNSLPASPAEAVFDFTLYGVDNDVLVNVREYRVAWLVERQASKPQSSATLTS